MEMAWLSGQCLLRNKVMFLERRIFLSNKGPQITCNHQNHAKRERERGDKGKVKIKES